MNLKAKYKLGVKRYLEGSTDAHGNPVEGWGPVEYLDVYAIAPTSSAEPAASGREAVITGLSVLAPVGVQIDAKDRAVIGDKEYTIEGDLADWNTGPFDFKPGVQINLKRVDG